MILDPRDRPEMLTERDRDWRALARERDRLPVETRWRVLTEDLVRGLVREWRDAR